MITEIDSLLGHRAIPLRSGLTLADAIRKGAAEHPPRIGNFTQLGGRGEIVATCAIGAALVGLLGAREAARHDYLASTLIQTFPELQDDRISICPADPACPVLLRGWASDMTLPFVSLFRTIGHLHDNVAHRWSRERIADWLDAREVA